MSVANCLFASNVSSQWALRGVSLTGSPTPEGADPPAAPSAAGCPGRSQHGLVASERAAPNGTSRRSHLGCPPRPTEQTRRLPRALARVPPAAPGARHTARSRRNGQLPMALGALTRLPKSGRRSGLGPVAMRPGAVRGVAPAPRALPGGGIRRPPTREITVTPPAISTTGSSRESRDSPPVREEAAPLAARERRPTFRQARVAQQRWRQATKPKPGSGSVVRLRGAARGARRPWRRRSRPRAASKNS